MTKTTSRTFPTEHRRAAHAGRLARFAGVAALTVGLGTAHAAVSDAWITTKAKMALLSTEDVRGTAVHVDTLNGQVTLHGKVASDAEKRKAEQAVSRIDGVQKVRNLLQVVPAEGRDVAAAADDDIEDQVEKALDDDPTLEGSSIDVESVNGGVVLLEGKARTLSDHLHAVETAAAVPGVKRVSSQIESPDRLGDDEIYSDAADEKAGTGAGIRGTASDMRITSAVKMRLMADERTPSLDINVDTTNGAVTLFGMVSTGEAKRAAEEDARQVSGVQKVDNQLQVVPEARQERVKADDAAISERVRARLAEDGRLREADISVDVENGVARLTGTVPGQAERLAAAVAARTAGARAVHTDLKVEPAE